jgi:ribosome-binding protein aMBF1 (putative translation factor)
VSVCLVQDDGTCTDPVCLEADYEAEISGEAEFRREVGRRLRTQRALRGLSQEDLGAGAGLSRAAVGKIERGVHKVDVWRLHLLAQALGVEVSVLLSERPEPR